MEWVDVLAETDLPEGKGTRAESPWGPLLLFRAGDSVFAISNVCSHQGASLHKGTVNRSATIPMATCPAHGSMFDMRGGSVRRGPAMHPVAAYDARAEDGRIQVAQRS